jgi:glucokinase
MLYLGIEIGGTKLQLGVGPADGVLRGLWRGTVDVAAGPNGIRDQILGAVPELLARACVTHAEIVGVGVGFGGPVNDSTGRVIKSHQIGGWANFPLTEWVRDTLGRPAAIGNDADVAGLAEALHGAGQGLSPIFYVTVGSGIGGGLIIGGEVYRGCGRGAAEVGHLRVYGGPLIGGIRREPLEDVASGWAIRRNAIQALSPSGSTLQRPAYRTGSGGAEGESLLRQLVDGDLTRLTAQHVGEAAARGDRLASEVLRFAVDALAEGLCHVIALLCPRRIIVGGGVALMGEETFFEPLRSAVARQVFKPFADCYDIVPAALGEEVVVHGALALARKRLRGNSPSAAPTARPG